MSIIVRAGFLPFKARLWGVSTELVVLTKIPLSCRSLISEFQFPSTLVLLKAPYQHLSLQTSTCVLANASKGKTVLIFGHTFEHPIFNTLNPQVLAALVIHQYFQTKCKIKKKIHLALVVSSGRVYLE